MAQLLVDGDGQPTAVPLHSAWDSVEPVQLDEHTVPLAEGRQAPAPSQPPCVQVDASALQDECGSCMAATFAQVPGLPGRLHALQPEQALAAVSQHSPSVQWPDLHSRSPAQLAPFDLGPHEPDMHGFGDEHCAAVVQLA